MALQRRKILAPLRDMLDEAKNEDTKIESVNLEEETAIDLTIKQEESIPVIEDKEEVSITEEPKTEEPVNAVEESEEVITSEESTAIPGNEAISDLKKVEENKVENVEENTTEENVSNVEKVSEEVTTEENTVEDNKEEQVEEKPKKRTRTSSKKKTLEMDDGDEKVEIINVSNAIGKSQNLQDVIATVIQEYKDPEFEEFKERLEENLLRTSFDDRADTGVIKMILANLSCCFDNVTKEYARVNSCLSQLNNKSYGLITRQIALNSIGTNDANRKRNGVHAPEIYKTSNGKTINLYGLEAALEKESLYLQMVMKQLEYKRSTLIAYLTANKLESNIIGE